VEWSLDRWRCSQSPGYGVLPRSALSTAEYLLPRILHVPPTFFLDSADHHSSFLGITHGDASIRYSFVFHLDTHLALTCLSTYLCIIGG
jgi:hypothetical protein